jgi:hypothetical protein
MGAMKQLATAMLLSFALLGSAAAREMPLPKGTVVTAPHWIAGSEWYYSDGYALKVTSLLPQGAVFDRLDAPGQWFSRQGFFRKDSVSATATRNAIYRTIPDAAGSSLTAGSPLTFQREYLSNGKLLVHASSWSLEGRETITVPAGTFDCYVIVWRTRSLRSDWTGFERWWYSPQIQNYVRMEFKYGPAPDGSRVLMRYRLGPEPEAAPVAAAAPASMVAAAPPEQITAPVAAPQQDAPAAPAAEPREAIAPKPPITAPEEAAAKPVPSKAAQVQAARNLPVAKPDAPPVGADGKAGFWHAQVGSSKDAAAMRISLDRTIGDNPQMEALPSGIDAHNVKGRGTFYRAWIGSYDNARDARALCGQLKTHGPGCAVFKSAIVEAKMN